MNKEIKISHISDTHGNKIKPDKNADIIILSGDMAPHNMDNFKFYVKDGLSETEVSGKSMFWNFRKIDAKAEGEYQKDWLNKEGLKHIKSRGIDFNKIIVINGNHDFYNSEELFTHGLYKGSKTIELQGLKIGLLTGINPYHNEWFDEINEMEFENRIQNIDRDIDILISHAPPRMILDMGYNEPIGSYAIYNAIFGHIGQVPYFYKLKAHFFGHAHEARGKITHTISDIDENERIVMFSNASIMRNDLILKVD